MLVYSHQIKENRPFILWDLPSFGLTTMTSLQRLPPAHCPRPPTTNIQYVQCYKVLVVENIKLQIDVLNFISNAPEKEQYPIYKYVSIVSHLQFAFKIRSTAYHINTSRFHTRHPHNSYHLRSLFTWEGCTQQSKSRKGILSRKADSGPAFYVYKFSFSFQMTSFSYTCACVGVRLQQCACVCVRVRRCFVFFRGIDSSFFRNAQSATTDCLPPKFFLLVSRVTRVEEIQRCSCTSAQFVFSAT